MLNEEDDAVPAGASIQHSTLNIQHSTFGLTTRRAAARATADASATTLPAPAAAPTAIIHRRSDRSSAAADRLAATAAAPVRDPFAIRCRRPAASASPLCVEAQSRDSVSRLRTFYE